MITLNRELRKTLEKAVVKARLVAEKGAFEALERLAVKEAAPWATMSDEQKLLRRRLRARARQLGDRRDSQTQIQDITRITQECAYEQWNRLIFARFLAEANLLIVPDTAVAISIEECQDLAREQNKDWLTLASEYAQKMLPEIFKQGDPVLEVGYAPEVRQELEKILKDLSNDVFQADDSLGWVYQFWQTLKKEANKLSGNKIGADELPAATQLFTEDYMVEFLLHNTLGAWWANKYGPIAAENETEARSCIALLSKEGEPSIHWEYLRLVQDGLDRKWRPASGSLAGWPKYSKDITILDPCMGSGHFLAFALPIIVRLRMEEEGLAAKNAVTIVLNENVYGLELDQRCSQIAAFNLAYTAWKLAGHQMLPTMNLACSGIAPNVAERDWIAVTGNNDRLKSGMLRLYDLFKEAPVLGSLINPRTFIGNIVEADFRELKPYLDLTLAQHINDDSVFEVTATAQGLAKAVEILSGQYTLVATNVPYLGRGKQVDVLKDYCERVHPDAKSDLATCFIERCLDFCVAGGTTALVTPQNWLFLGAYKKMRLDLLKNAQFNLVALLGENSFESPQAAGAFPVVFTLSKESANKANCFSGIDISKETSPLEKSKGARVNVVSNLNQMNQLKNPDGRISFEKDMGGKLLSDYSSSFVGLQNGDSPRFILYFWEVPKIRNPWEAFHLPCDETIPFGGRQGILRWDEGKGELVEFEGCYIKGREAWGKKGIAIRHMRKLPATLYSGDLYDQNIAVIVPNDPSYLPAIWAFCSSKDFNLEVRKIDKATKVTNSTLVKIPFDFPYWEKISFEKYPTDLPTSFSDDPSQWLFNGNPKGAQNPLHVAIARLTGYLWPRQTGSSFPDCQSIQSDQVQSEIVTDGIICLPSVNRDETAAHRLRYLLTKEYRETWDLKMEKQLLLNPDKKHLSIESWLFDSFSEEHNVLFCQRPFVWQLWDGLSDGFNVLLNYHSLSEANGQGRKLLEKLTYTYLGDWIARSESDMNDGVPGADARVAAAKHLQSELKKILFGDVPYDIFVRWKPLHQQPIGWDPDINDGIRVNIRPFMTAKTLNGKSIFRTPPKIKWEKDRGKEPVRSKVEFPWLWNWDKKTNDFLGGPVFDGNRWNELHYSRLVKEKARKIFSETTSNEGLK